MDEQRSNEVKDRLKELNALLDNKVVVQESEELFSSPPLQGLMASILMSVGMSDMDTLDACQVCFAIGWSLGRLELEGNETVINVTKDFPSDSEVLEIVNEELSLAIRTAFPQKGADPDTWEGINWDEEVLQ